MLLKRIKIFYNFKNQFAMTRISVDYSNLASFEYDSNSKILEIEFNSGGVYQYFNVSDSEYKNLMNADSHGKYFVANIRNDYRFLKVG